MRGTFSLNRSKAMNDVGYSYVGTTPGVARNHTISNGSKPCHYIFMWIVGVLKVEIRPLP